MKRMIDVQNVIAQNIAQLHTNTAIEVPKFLFWICLLLFFTPHNLVVLLPRKVRKENTVMASLLLSAKQCMELLLQPMNGIFLAGMWSAQCQQYCCQNHMTVHSMIMQAFHWILQSQANEITAQVQEVEETGERESQCHCLDKE